jgi:endonuclease YncB( thermonuclease family)
MLAVAVLRRFRLRRSLAALALLANAAVPALSEDQLGVPRPQWGAFFSGKDQRVPVEPTASCAGLEPGPTRTVARIIDGETVALDDGAELRLIGALAPRASDADAEPGAWPMEAAAMQALRGLLLGKTIELRFAGGRADRYGRLQAHAFLIEPGGRRWVQRDLVENGQARAYASAGSRACSVELLAAEHAARAAPRGLWAEAAYQVRQADQPAELLRYRTTFQVIEGSIVRVAQVRGTIYLNFDRNWRQGFSVSLRRDDSGLLGSYEGNPEGLEGRLVRVRGWIEQRGGAPAIDLSDGGLIEVVTAAARQPEPAR